jgi:hypothetical protein
MAYFIFDMDQTLADPFSAFYFIDSLRALSKKYKTDRPYNTFVQDILSEETSNKPLGILRPGILPIFIKLKGLQEKGKIKSVIIYSNNGHLESLEFIRDLIHLYIGTDNLISECIHWYHPMRNSERIVKPGIPNKTWNILKNIMIKGNCKAPKDLDPRDAYFFDDLDHPDLQRNLGDNYYKVPAYSFKASVIRIADIYRSALNGVSNINKNSIDNVIQTFKNKTKGTAAANVLPPPADKGITMIEDAISRVDNTMITGGGKFVRFKTIKRKRKCCNCRLRRTSRKN